MVDRRTFLKQLLAFAVVTAADPTWVVKTQPPIVVPPNKLVQFNELVAKPIEIVAEEAKVAPSLIAEFDRILMECYDKAIIDYLNTPSRLLKRLNQRGKNNGLR